MFPDALQAYCGEGKRILNRNFSVLPDPLAGLQMPEEVGVPDVPDKLEEGYRQHHAEKKEQDRFLNTGIAHAKFSITELIDLFAVSRRTTPCQAIDAR
jgi:hypothetical protein